MMWDRDDSWMHGSAYGEWFMFIGLIAIIAAVVVLVVYLIRQTSQPATRSTPALQGYPAAGVFPPAQSQGPLSETPRDILKRRYANGEIEREEYLQKLADLGG